jgi:uncharacterized protein
MTQELITYLAQQLVEKSELVNVSSADTDEKYVVQVLVAPQDLARVIGSEGRTFRALKAVVTLTHPQSPADLVVDSIQQ